ENVTLDVVPGEMLGLVGPNGSGKSTLLHCLAGLRTPSGGEVTLDKHPVSAMSRRQVAQRIAFVSQQADTVDRISVLEAVQLGRTPWLGALTPYGTKDSMIVEAALTDTDIVSLAQRRWQTLSGGERQRAHIARALAQTPKILLLDEPTNHLDIRHQLAIMALLRRLPLTVVVALHDLNHAMACDRVAVMRGGRLVAIGPPHETLTPEHVASAFGVHTQKLI